MPLHTGKSQKAFSENVRELMHGKLKGSRAKAVHTIAKKSGMPDKAARIKQALAIAYSKKRGK